MFVSLRCVYTFIFSRKICLNAPEYQSIKLYWQLRMFIEQMVVMVQMLVERLKLR